MAGESGYDRAVADNALIWRPDVLAGFEAAPLEPATLVRLAHQAPTPRAVVLHVHGRNDYFFHSHVAQVFAEAGHAFYAVDMRRAGRSVKAGDIPHHVTFMAELGDDISAAVDAVGAAHPGLPVVVHAHSTGGLAALIWAADRGHPRLAGLILDSPLPGLPRRAAGRMARLALPVVARLAPTRAVAHPTSPYAAGQHVSNGGRWDFSLAWKRPEGVSVTAGWAAAVLAAERRIGRGITVERPVLVARCDSSGVESCANPDLDSQDTVVDVARIAWLSARIRGDVTELVVPGGVHDLTLSAPTPRAVYLDGVLAWIDRVLS